MTRLVEFVSARGRKRVAVNSAHVMYVEEIDGDTTDITLPVSGGEKNDFGAIWLRVEGSYDEVSGKLEDAIRGAK